MLDYWSKNKHNFDFLERGLGIVFLPHFMNNFSWKMFQILYSINWKSFIVWFPLLLEILDSMCIAIICYPGWDVINFEINLIFLIKQFFYMTKKSRQKVKYLEKEKKLLRWNKNYFSSILKDFQLPKIVSDLQVCLEV